MTFVLGRTKNKNMPHKLRQRKYVFLYYFTCLGKHIYICVIVSRSQYIDVIRSLTKNKIKFEICNLKYIISICVMIIILLRIK